MKVFDIKKSNLKLGSRYTPPLYHYTDILKAQFSNEGIPYVKLDSSICTVSDGEHSAIPRNSTGGIRYLYGRNIKEGIINFDPISDSSYIDNKDYLKFTRCHINENDVLIAIYGTVGKSAVYHENQVGKAGIPRHIANISLKQDAPLTPEYLSCFFRTKYGRNQIFSVMSGNLQQLFSLKNIRDFDVPLVTKDNFMEMITELERKAINYEIEANNEISKAKEIFYDALNFDIRSIKGDLTFSVPLSSIKETRVLSPTRYNTLYSKVAKEIKSHKYVLLKNVIEHWHGVEPGSDNYIDYLNRSLNDYSFIRTSDVVNSEADLYPDFYLTENCVSKVPSNQILQNGDVFFSKDGKIGAVGMVTQEDRIILSSGFEISRLNDFGRSQGLTQEYLFLVLSIPEVGRYGALRRTVVASTIPHLRPRNFEDIEIPILKRDIIFDISNHIKHAFKLKAKRKSLLKKSTKTFDAFFESEIN